jgi:hypothetical protein
MRLSITTPLFPPPPHPMAELTGRIQTDLATLPCAPSNERGSKGRLIFYAAVSLAYLREKPQHRALFSSSPVEHHSTAPRSLPETIRSFKEIGRKEQSRPSNPCPAAMEPGVHKGRPTEQLQPPHKPTPQPRHCENQCTVASGRGNRGNSSWGKAIAYAFSRLNSNSGCKGKVRNDSSIAHPGQGPETENSFGPRFRKEMLHETGIGQSPWLAVFPLAGDGRLGAVRVSTARACPKWGATNKCRLADIRRGVKICYRRIAEFNPLLHHIR